MANYVEKPIGPKGGNLQLERQSLDEISPFCKKRCLISSELNSILVTLQLKQSREEVASTRVAWWLFAYFDPQRSTNLPYNLQILNSSGTRALKVKMMIIFTFLWVINIFSKKGTSKWYNYVAAKLPDLLQSLERNCLGDSHDVQKMFSSSLCNSQCFTISKCKTFWVKYHTWDKTCIANIVNMHCELGGGGGLE